MTPLLSREQMRAYDDYAIQKGHLPGLLLMENAGRAAADIIERELEPLLGCVVVVAGCGNNGGDGLVVARQLAARGHEVHCFLTDAPEKMSEEARLQVKVLGGLGHPPRLLGSDGSDLRHELAGADVIIDAVFGIGLNRAIDGRLAEFIEAINASHAVRVALDVPSGIDSNNGQVLGTAVNAGITIAFAHRKLGLCQGAAVRHTGTIHVADLGIPDETILHEVGYAAQLVDDGEVVAALGGRAPDAHKYRNGNVLVVAGSSGKTGAALLTATAALRAGAGVATIATWPQAIASIETRVREVMTHRIDSANLRADLQNALHKRSAVAIGPGLGLDAAARKLIEAVVIEWSGPVVVDADAITAFAGRAAQLKAAAGPRVLTPHAGELARLIRSDSASIEKDRVQAAQEAAELTGSVIVLKGPYSIIASPEGDCYICNAVNPLLATAGSGDVLAGIIAALLHSAPTSACAAAAGVQLHASAAAAWSEQHGGAQRGMLAGDIAAMLPIAIQRFGTWPVGG